jgi:hypothetical protein
MSLPHGARMRFWTKVKKTRKCWLWTGCTSDFGHGTIRVQGRLYRAHRVSWEIANGDISEGLCVLHRCDVPACVRPEHLFLGTKADNTADMMQKNRGRYVTHRGEAVGTAKLTRSQVADIRRRYGPPPGRGRSRGKPTQHDLAAEYGVSQGTIGFIVREETWE